VARCSSRRDRGQAFAEFALVLPVVLVIVMAVADFGRAYSCWVTITNAAREGARLGVTGATADQITQRVQTTVGSAYNNASLAVTPTNAQGASGSDITVTVNYQLAFITPIAALAKLLVSTSAIPTTYTLTSQAVMRIE
jgi:Flp pilus assembly protein TadG